MLAAMELRCVVCGGPVVGEAHYADAWERSRKKFPCCGAACAGRFDPDLHWLPATLPALAVGDERARLRTLARQRFRALDQPRPVVRELLLAGVEPDVLRALLAESREASAGARGHNRLRMLAFLFGSRRRHEQDPDERSDRAYADAEADLAQWETVLATRARAT